MQLRIERSIFNSPHQFPKFILPQSPSNNLPKIDRQPVPIFITYDFAFHCPPANHKLDVHRKEVTTSSSLDHMYYEWVLISRRCRHRNYHHRSHRVMNWSAISWETVSRGERQICPFGLKISYRFLFSITSIRSFGPRDNLWPARQSQPLISRWWEPCQLDKWQSKWLTAVKRAIWNVSLLGMSRNDYSGLYS